MNKLYFHKSKRDFFIKIRKRADEKELFVSEKYFLRKVIKNGQKILDVGCAAGGLYNILSKQIGYINYTGMDMDPLCIRAAKAMYPEAKFIAGDFFGNKFKDDTFDTVISLLLMSLQPNYKKFISELIRVSRKYILVDARLKYEGPTIVDKDISYFYYHSSGKRNYYIVHNLFELLNFFHIERLHIKKISVVGCYPKENCAFVPFRKDKMLMGMFCLEKYPKEERKFIRHGGYKGIADRSWCKLDIRLPGFKTEWFLK